MLVQCTCTCTYGFQTFFFLIQRNVQNYLLITYVKLVCRASVIRATWRLLFQQIVPFNYKWLRVIFVFLILSFITFIDASDSNNVGTEDVSGQLAQGESKRKYNYRKMVRQQIRYYSFLVWRKCAKTSFSTKIATFDKWIGDWIALFFSEKICLLTCKNLFFRRDFFKRRFF